MQAQFTYFGTLKRNTLGQTGLYWGSALLIYLSYTSVQVSVVINAWYGPFYDDIQNALTGSGEVTSLDLYSHLGTFSLIAFPYIALIIANRFFTSHYIFRWRTAMNDYYVERWAKN